MLKPTLLKRRLFYLTTDVLVVLGASLLTYATAHRTSAPDIGHLAALVTYAAAGLLGQLGLSMLFFTYNLKWATFSLTDVPRTVTPSVGAALLLASLTGLDLLPGLSPWSAVTWGLLNVGGVLAVRGSKRFYHEVMRPRSGKRAILVVCSEKAYFLLDTIRRIRQMDYHVIGFVDPDVRNRGAVSQGMPVLGAFDDIERIVARHRVQAAIVLLSADPTFPTGGIQQQLRALGLEVRLVPSLAGAIESRPEGDELERTAIHELTGRPPVVADAQEMRRQFGGKRILVTGAGGSIGAELCRQLARFEPETVVLFERDDSNLFRIETQLRRDHPMLDVAPHLGDVARAEDVRRAFERTRPHVVFHAAAYKHVPILEFHPAEAVRVNVMGSRNVAEAAVRYGSESFVYISTDKAVNPTSVMGATKRLGEMVTMSMNGTGRVRFLAVRFGNVLGSRSSVSTIFRDAIASRLPVTVTHPEMERYFMLCSEAVLLVMQAVAIGRGGEVFVLDMGRPVRIKDLAEAMIRNAGLRPDVDVPVVYTGRRPGERLREELLTAEEGTTATMHQRIWRARVSAGQTHVEPGERLRLLEALAQNGNAEHVRAELAAQVPSYRPDRDCLNGRPTASGRAWVGAALAPSAECGCDGRSLASGCEPQSVGGQS